LLEEARSALRAESYRLPKRSASAGGMMGVRAIMSWHNFILMLGLHFGFGVRIAATSTTLLS